ncbi:MAG TPA: Panacea domain-containing protein [Candidatus Elarobacter sp.]|nr:Panacea domain-containing protein [Candidatus Elarobacter sp.]
MSRASGFNEKKATQVAARFLEAAGRSLPYMSLLKLMYITDREALRRWHAPVTNDRYVSMKLGPVLSGVYDLIVVPSETATYWHRHISSPSDYSVSLLNDPGDDQLAPAEEKLVDETLALYGTLWQWQLSDLTHDFEEWKDPDGSSIPIAVSEILGAVGVEERAAEAIARELRGFDKMRALSRQ